MTFSTWQDDCGDQYDPQSVEQPIQQLCQECVNIFVQLQEPADSAVAWIKDKEKLVKDDINKAKRRAIDRINKLASAVFSELELTAASLTGNAVIAAGQVHRDLLAAGIESPAIPSTLGESLSSFGGIGNSFATQSTATFQSAADNAAAADDKQGQGEAVLAFPEASRLGTADASPVPAISGVERTAAEYAAQLQLQQATRQQGTQDDSTLDADLDRPLVFMFGERAARWHPQAIAWVGKGLEELLSSASLQGLIDSRTIDVVPDSLPSDLIPDIR